jgi:predicted ribosomally synthesized peptide with SipW-like signal peptide
MKKILLSLGIIAVVAVGAVGATRSFFSDTETSTGNTFTAGAIDLKIDSKATYNGAPVDGSTWAVEKDLVVGDKFFNFGDIKPGDEGKNTISMHVLNNDAYVCAAVSNLVSNDVSQTEPESEAPLDTDDMVSGELDDQMVWTIWKDLNNDGVQDGGSETVLASGNPVNGVLALYDSITGPLLSTNTAYLGVEWTLPSSSGNETQTDSLTGDISFYTVQSRNNENFKCSDWSPVEQEEEVWVETTQAEGDASIIGEGDEDVLKLVTINDTASRVRYTNDNLDLDVADVASISYDSKQVSAIDSVNGNASMRLTVDLDGNVLTNDTVEITYEPYYNYTSQNPSSSNTSIIPGTWQTWNTTLANGKFWANGGFLGSTPSGGAYATNFTLAQVQAAHPNAKIIGISLGMGTWNVGQVVLVDNVTVNATVLGF